MRSSVSVARDDNPDMIEFQFRGGDRHALRLQRNNPIIKMNVVTTRIDSSLFLFLAELLETGVATQRVPFRIEP